MQTRSLSLLLSLTVILLTATHLDAKQQIVVLVGSKAPALEKFAASQLQQQFQRLFDADVDVTSKLPRDQRTLVLIGSPTTNPAIKKLIGKRWPKLSEQGILLRSFSHRKRHALVVGGGSPVATLWAVYELGHQFGIRYLTRDDFYPETPVEMKLGQFDQIMEPKLRTRTWRTVNDFAMGPESWGLADQKQLLGQLAKMKFNRIMISLWPWQPFVHYEFRGVKKQTAMLWFGDRFRVDGETPGKKVFSGAKYFENPDLAGKTSYEEMTTAGIQLISGIVQEAQRLGMTVGIAFFPFNFPREFSNALPGSKPIHQLKQLTIGPGKQEPDDPLLKELVTTKLRAYIETYPTVDAIYLYLPEFPEWDEHVDAAWQQLNQEADLGGLTLDNLVKTARNRNVIASGDRGVRALRGNIVPLAFFQSLFSDAKLLQRPDGDKVELIFTGIDTALYPVLDRILPEGTGMMSFIDYTARRSVENRELISKVPSDKVKSSMIFTLADDNVGVVQQSVTASIHELVQDLHKYGWDGFSTRYWMLAELDPTLHYLSRASFDEEVTPRSAHDDLFITITGNSSTSDRLWRAFEYMETATDMIDKQGLGFSFPVEGMLMKHYHPQPAPAWWNEIKELYTESMIEFFRATSNTHQRGEWLLNYFANRSVYVTQYIASVEALRAAAIAKEAGDLDTTVEQLETAIESMYNAIDTLSNVVYDQSDRGLIAVLANFAYQPLLKEYEKTLDELDAQ